MEWQQRLAASAVGAAAAEVLTLPLDVAKTRMQLNRRAPTQAASSAAVHDTHAAKTHQRSSAALEPTTSLPRLLVSIARHEGGCALYKGLTPALVRQVCYSSLTLLLYEPMLAYLLPRLGHATYAARLLTGGTSGAIAIFLCNPVELAKTQLQRANAVETTILGVICRVVAREGAGGLWSGVSPNVIRAFLVNAAELGTYDEVNRTLTRSMGRAAAHLCASMSSGVVSAAVASPADVLKTRLMERAGSFERGGAAFGVSPGDKDVSGLLAAAIDDDTDADADADAGEASRSPLPPARADVSCAAVFHVLCSTYREEGVAAFYQGVVPSACRTMLWVSTFFLVYEAMRSALRDEQTDALQ